MRLAVLSACSTGNGEQIAGEGLVGVSRAFLTAGIQGVVASLWPVDSAATVALRQEKLEGNRPTRPLKAKDAEAPAENAGAYFWSPFILMTLGH
ncbi:CHAT domain-containing protein [Thiohalorhabdus methylotrophus]|uniref:CHAT domain-containing protein n=1 Tax=Thiohalorhabdus methylotrophus TaxID=3242694 RepID=A0ABV4TZV5_9GAMM